MTTTPTLRVFEDCDWLLSNGVDPVHVTQQLGKTVAGLEKLARTNGRPDLSRLFGAEASRGRRR